MNEKKLINLTRIVESTSELNELTSGSGGLLDYVSISGYEKSNYIFFKSDRDHDPVQIPVDLHTLVYQRESKKSFLEKENCYLIKSSYTPQRKETDGLGRTYRAELTGKLMYFPNEGD